MFACFFVFLLLVSGEFVFCVFLVSFWVYLFGFLYLYTAYKLRHRRWWGNFKKSASYSWPLVSRWDPHGERVQKMFFGFGKYQIFSVWDHSWRKRNYHGDLLFFLLHFYLHDFICNVFFVLSEFSTISTTTTTSTTPAMLPVAAVVDTPIVIVILTITEYYYYHFCCCYGFHYCVPTSTCIILIFLFVHALILATTTLLLCSMACFFFLVPLGSVRVIVIHDMNVLCWRNLIWWFWTRRATCVHA